MKLLRSTEVRFRLNPRLKLLLQDVRDTTFLFLVSALALPEQTLRSTSPCLELSVNRVITTASNLFQQAVNTFKRKRFCTEVKTCTWALHVEKIKTRIDNDMSWKRSSQGNSANTLRSQQTDERAS